MSLRGFNLAILAISAGIILFATPARAFGAGNIASISKVENVNWRHGDVEDTLKTLAFLKGGKWTSKMIKRVYFGNWLRDYSQAVDVGTLKGVPAETLRVLVWILSFMSFGYATREYEVTSQRLGVYRPEEHIDNPKDYADNLDARSYDPRLRPPVHPVELAVDPNTGLKNYIANESGGWATSSGYVKYSLDRSIHYGRIYTSGTQSGKTEDLAEALRCLGQALHTLEDYSAHSNYCELVLREMGFDVFPHTGSASAINLRGKNVFPIVTGTFGGLDFLHSVLGEAQDKLTQNELEEMDLALEDAQGKRAPSSSSSSSRDRGLFGSSSGSTGQNSSDLLMGMLGQIPGAGNFGAECARLQAASDEQENQNRNSGMGMSSRDMASTGRAFFGGGGGAPGSGGVSAQDPQELVKKIYPILEFRDNVVRAIESAIDKIPGLTALVEKISETLTVLVFSLLAPFIRPIIAQVTIELKKGSEGVLDSSANHQFEPWTDAHCTDPTHSVLSKDHFSNRLNGPCGQIASAVVAYVVPRIVYAWENPRTPVPMVLEDVCQVFHHPAIRDPKLELQNKMYSVVQKWVQSLPDRGAKINSWLSRDAVRAGKNHTDGIFGGGMEGGHGKVEGSDLAKTEKLPKRNLNLGSSSSSYGSYNDPMSQLTGAMAGAGIGAYAGGGASSDYYGSSSQGTEERKRSKHKHHKSSSSSGRVKDDEYYRRKAERKARKEREKDERREHKHRRKSSRNVNDDDDSDSDDSDDSDDEPKQQPHGGRPLSSHGPPPYAGGYSGPPQHPYDYNSRDESSYEHQQPAHDYSASSYSNQQPYGQENYQQQQQQQQQQGYPQHHGGPPPPPPPQDGSYGMSMPGGFPSSDMPPPPHHHGNFGPPSPGYPPPSSDPGRPPYPYGEAAPYNVSGGYNIGGDGAVDYTSHHHHQQQQNDFGYGNGGGGEYSSAGHNGGYGAYGGYNNNNGNYGSGYGGYNQGY